MCNYNLRIYYIREWGLRSLGIVAKLNPMKIFVNFFQVLPYGLTMARN